MVERLGWILMGIAVLMGQAGCLAPRASEGPPHTYFLSLDDQTWGTDARMGEKAGDQVLLINLPQAEAGFDTPKIAYLRRPLEVSYYATNQWADTPSRMLIPLLVRTFEKTGRWRAVIPMPTPVRGDYRLETTGLVLQQEFLQQPSRVRVAVRAQLVDLRDYRALGARLFEVIEPAASDDAYGGVLAANKALTKLLQDVAGWVNGCVGESGRSHCP